MYQSSNPYTGVGTINLQASEWSTLGLGIDASVPQENGPAQSVYHSPNPGSPGTDAEHPRLVRFLRAHPYIKARLKARAAGALPPGVGSLGDTGTTADLTSYFDSVGLTTTGATDTGGFDWSGFSQVLTPILSDANSIAKIVLTPGGSYTSVGPGGVMTSYQGTGTPTSSAILGIPGLSTATGSLSPVVLMGLAAVALVVFMSMGKR